MPSQRAPGQTPIITMMKKEFVSEIDQNLGRLGFSDRSALVREAVYEKMAREGIEIPAELYLPPSRKGKGGAKYKRSRGPSKRKKL